MKLWEYAIFHSPEPMLGIDLTQYGKDGWELVQVVIQSPRSFGSFESAKIYVHYFKRPKVD